ncbi:MAG TPA: zinc-binding dehydrogenase [Acidimicrobiales bacterium]|nr:zinc-binding dehydrogenase [Acidimicrobiales bacterium]
MHAIVQHEFGPADSLRLEHVRDPEPGAGQVRIAVAAAGVHVIDTAIRRGESGPYPRPDLPMIPGREVAGRVDQLGPQVDGDWLGRPVVAHLGMASGGYAPLAVAPVDALHVIPDGLDPVTAVAMIGTGRTAVGVLGSAEIVADDTVLVTAAAGGLGALLVQAARGAGAEVVGLAGGPDKVERVRKLGATAAIDYRATGWPDAVRAALGDRQPTLLLDGVGGAAARDAFDLLGPAGRVVLYGGSSGQPLALTTADLAARSLRVTWALGARMLGLPGGIRALETRALGEAAAGRLVPLVNDPFPLGEAAAAHRAIEERATVGKVVLVP